MSTLKPSDLGVWRWNADDTKATWVWIYKPAEIRIVERHPKGKRDDVREQPFVLRIAENPDYPGRWLTTSCGRHVGSTRHRFATDITDAQAQALAWLDRRYQAVTA